MSGGNVSEQKVFDITGRPSVEDIDQIVHALTNKTFNQALKLFMDKKMEKSLALEDILSEIHIAVMSLKMQD